jgi:hypothetical protein
MARPFTLKLNHTVQYWKTPSRAVPAKVISITNQSTFTLKGPAGTTWVNPTRQVLSIQTKPRVADRWSPY